MYILIRISFELAAKPNLQPDASYRLQIINNIQQHLFWILPSLSGTQGELDANQPTNYREIAVYFPYENY